MFQEEKLFSWTLEEQGKIFSIYLISLYALNIFCFTYYEKWIYDIQCIIIAVIIKWWYDEIENQN
jgi:hypothetical protein